MAALLDDLGIQSVSVLAFSEGAPAAALAAGTRLREQLVVHPQVGDGDAELLSRRHLRGGHHLGELRR